MACEQLGHSQGARDQVHEEASRWSPCQRLHSSYGTHALGYLKSRITTVLGPPLRKPILGKEKTLVSVYIKESNKLIKVRYSFAPLNTHRQPYVKQFWSFLALILTSASECKRPLGRPLFLYFQAFITGKARANAEILDVKVT